MVIMGSKTRVSKYIVLYLQKEIDYSGCKCYIEPFVGGANIIDKIVCKKKIGLDLNRYLIALLKAAQEGKPLYDEVDRELYNKVRVNFAGYEDYQVGAVGYLASYNGRFFDGGFARDTIYKDGKTRRYYQEKKKNLLSQAQSDLFKDITFLTGDYQSLNPSDSFIYCDPPYAGAKKYLNAYKFDYDAFWDKMRQWSENNRVFISETMAPDDFECVLECRTYRSIKATEKQRAKEKLFVYKKAIV